MNEKFILTVIEKFDSGTIGELNLDDGTYHLTLKKMGYGAENAHALQETASGESIHPGKNQSNVKLNIPAESGGDTITSPIVATFYASPGPDAPPFVKPGTKVRSGQTLCILEAMKMMNHLEAEFNCEIIETHAISGDLVEYGQTLFTVKRL